MPVFARCPAFVFVVPFATGCSGYVPSTAPIAPGIEVVRVPFGRPQPVIVRREPEAGSTAVRVDTVRGITAAYGQVMAVRGDTITLGLTQVSRDGQLTRFPRGTIATVAATPGRPVERWGYSSGRTRALVITSGAVVAAAVAAFGVLIAVVSQMK